MQDIRHTSFFIARSGKAHGPLSWTEIDSYLAYGSLKPQDLVCTADSPNWLPVTEWKKAIEGDPESEEKAEPRSPWLAWWHRLLTSSKAGSKATPRALRRRTVRFREWNHVPEDQRSTGILLGIVLGFLFFPPRFWSACSRVFSNHVFRPVADEAGYLKIWPKWMETVCTVLLLVNAAYWLFVIYQFNEHVMPFLRQALDLMIQGAKDWSL